MLSRFISHETDPTKSIRRQPFMRIELLGSGTQGRLFQETGLSVEVWNGFTLLFSSTGR